MLIKTGAECNSGDTNLGHQDTIQQCARKCADAAGCDYFIFGTGSKTGNCYFENTGTGACTQGWEPDEYNFYALDKAGTHGTAQDPSTVVAATK